MNSIQSVLEEFIVRKLIENSQRNVQRNVLDRFINSCSCKSACKCSGDQTVYKDQAFPNSLEVEVNTRY